MLEIDELHLTRTFSIQGVIWKVPESKVANMDCTNSK